MPNLNIFSPAFFGLWFGRRALSVGLLLFIITPATVGQTKPQPERPSTVESRTDQNAASEEITVPDSPADPKARQKRELKLMLTLAIIVICSLFFLVLIISIFRMGRHLRGRLKLHKKNYPTEYVDAWSQYRIKETEEEKGPS